MSLDLSPTETPTRRFLCPCWQCAGARREPRPTPEPDDLDNAPDEHILFTVVPELLRSTAALQLRVSLVALALLQVDAPPPGSNPAAAYRHLNAALFQTTKEWNRFHRLSRHLRRAINATYPR